ncbi:blue-sensitive opsin [Exaiptasia diaphana]|uniref:G-protein coupled receptors family 1 profile domain-containing protein n=1 Tax=Exaiptasia diaphana TaxID=2652724 RepID=A0A913X4G3_EXADI|nr:blue-sensitive opsin [Exaiptasia diaphana]XP_020898809.1 blue-sensitive opsin [Exaiptasia diaphana]XP_020898817.1 blue-sensitive opsin [Exaiptasia diaphana]
MNNTSMVNNPKASRGSDVLPYTEAWLFGFGLESLTIITLNVLTLIVLTQTYGLRKRTTYFLINLAVTDLFVGLLPLPMYMINIANPVLMKSNAVLYEAFQFLDMMFGACSVWTLALISLERLCIVLMPYAHRSAKLRSYFCAIGFCWLLPAIVGVIGFLPKHGLLNRTVYLYIIFLSLLFIPTATLVISHIALGVKFNQRSNKIRRARQENDLSKTLLIVTGTFLVSCLPFQTLVFFIALDPKYPIQLTIIVALKLLQYANSFMNPIIYWPRLPGFKEAARKLLPSKSKRSARQYLPPTSSSPV